MAEAHDGGSSGADFDLSQFYQIFFEEAGENLDLMEQMLLELDLASADDEELNGIFRCAHSIKGGAATFGFSDVAELTHHMESLLDKLRRRELKPIPQMVDVLLESADASRGLLAVHQAGGEGTPPSTEDLVRRISELASGGVPAAPAPAPVAAPAAAPAPAAVAAGGTRSLEIVIGPLGRPEQADAIPELFRDIPGLGTIEARPSAQADLRVFAVETASSDDELLDLFVFHVAKDQVKIRDLAAAPAAAPAPEIPGFGLFDPVEPPAVVASASAAPAPASGFGFFAGAPGVPDAPAAPAAKAVEAEATKAVVPAKAAEPKAHTQAQLEAATIRVAVNKVDQLINLVGELVITQAMLAQNSRSLDPALNQQLLAGLADLDRNTRDLQESVMSIRMIPMSIVFSRFPRMLRDLANKLGKKVDLITQGEATELDKGLVEKITDPLTHLVRNSCDHGIELPEDRLAKGKSAQGTITLS